MSGDQEQTEDELLQMAIAMSLQEAAAAAAAAEGGDGASSPAAGAEDVTTKRRRVADDDAPGGDDAATTAMDLDEETARAIELSMLERQPGEDDAGAAGATAGEGGGGADAAAAGGAATNPFAALFAPAPAPASAPAAATTTPQSGHPDPPPPPQPVISAAALAAAFGGAAAAAASASAAAPSQPTTRRPRAAAARGGKKRASAVAAPPPPSAEARAALDEWWRRDGEEGDGDAAVAVPDASTACEVLSRVMRAPVVAPGVESSSSSSSSSFSGAPIQISFSQREGGVRVARKMVDALTRTRFSPSRLSSPLGGSVSKASSSACEVIGACHHGACVEAAAAAAASDAAVTADTAALPTTTMLPLLTSLRKSIAKHLLTLLEDDGDDLYFEGGRSRREFADACARGFVAPALIEDVLDQIDTPARSSAWEDTMRQAFKGMGDAALDDVDASESAARAIDALTRSPRCARAVSKVLRAELDANDVTILRDVPGADGVVRGTLGAKAVATCALLGPAMGRGVLATLLDGRSSKLVNARDAPSLWTTLPRYPKCPPGDREKLGWITQRGAKTTRDAAHGALLRVVKQKGPHMETVLAWMSAAAIEAGEYKKRKEDNATHRGGAFADSRACDDDWLVGLAAIALRFARPVADGADRLIGARLMDVSPLRKNWRFDWRDAAPSLTRKPRGDDDDDDEGASGEEGKGKGVSGEGASSSVSFVAETFFVAHAAFQSALLPVVRRFEEASGILRDRAVGKATQHGGNADAASSAASGPLDVSAVVAADVDLNAHGDCGVAALLDPDLAGDACRFALLTCVWLERLASLAPAEAEAAFDVVPETFLTATCDWVCFVLRHGKAELLLDGGGSAGDPTSPVGGVVTKTTPTSPTTPNSSSSSSSSLTVSALARCAVSLLSKPHLVTHPTTRASLVDMLQHIIIGEGGRVASASTLGVRGSATHELLVSSVLGSAETRASLCPALIRAYVAMDAVEGLDVDRDRFDKFHTRDVIARLIGELWRIDACVDSVAKLGREEEEARDGDGGAGGTGGPGLFEEFASCMLGDLMYVLQDSLDRLGSVSDMQKTRYGGDHGRSEADGAPTDDLWASLPAREREERERFLASQERTARGFLRHATQTLALLNLMGGSADVAPAFVSNAAVAGKAAYAVVHFLEVLLGEKGAAGLVVRDPKKYGFHPKKLILAIVEFTARLHGVAGSRGTSVGGFVGALAREDDYDARTLEKARELLVRKTFGAAVLPPTLRMVIDGVAAIRGGGRFGGHDVGHVGHSPITAPDGIGTSSKPSGVSSPSSSSSSRGFNAEEAAALVAALGPEPPDDEVSRAYKSEETLPSFAESDGGAPMSDFFTPYLKMSSDTSSDNGGSKKKQKRLAREVASLSEPGALPRELTGSIFVRHDVDRLDRMRAVVVGADGTPYDGGCFVFDVYFPANYPAVAPLVNLDTTGGGRARFNPNLYADGKVCLSLLGTWHGGSAEEKWDPERSSLSQVLVSVQGLIMCEDPMYNEPGFDGIRGTPEGANKSKEYDEDVRLNTARHAMVAHLRRPRRGVNDAIRTHFRLRRWRTMRTVLRWCEEASDETRRARLWDAAKELGGLLAALKDERDE